MWALVVVGICGTGNVLAKNVPAPSYDAAAKFSGFANGGGPKGPGFTSGNGGELSIDARTAAGFFPAAR
jgi:hypothetical protein